MVVLVHYFTCTVIEDIGVHLFLEKPLPIMALYHQGWMIDWSAFSIATQIDQPVIFKWSGNMVSVGNNIEIQSLFTNDQSDEQLIPYFHITFVTYWVVQYSHTSCVFQYVRVWCTSDVIRMSWQSVRVPSRRVLRSRFLAHASILTSHTASQYTATSDQRSATTVDRYCLGYSDKG